MIAFERIEALTALAEEAGVVSVAQDARALLERVREGRFFVACLGQFKRGKSTLINALLGEELLPSGVAPVTSVVTVVRWGERRARVRIGSDEWREILIDELGEFVSESKNPQNRKGVTGVEVFCKSPFLERGLCLVDTPGIGSVFAGNTEETESFVPQIDAALVVLGGDPPITGDELALVKGVAERVHNLLFLLNKADRLSAVERSEALGFTRAVLREALGNAEPRIFEVSALERLRGEGSEREWQELVARLDELARDGGMDLVTRAAARGFVSLSERLELHLREERSALLRPVAESEQRLENLRRCARDAEQAASELKFVFDAEQQKLARQFDEKRARFVEAALPEVMRGLDERLLDSPARRGPGARTFAIRQALAVTEPVVSAWMDRERPVAEREFAAVTERFVIHANAFLDRLADSGQLPADLMPVKLIAEAGLRARSRYYFASFMTLGTPLLWLWIADWFRSGASARAAAREAGFAFAKQLLEVNANRVVADFDERITESRRGVEGTLRRTLQETVATAENAAARAREVRQRGAAAVERALLTLDAQTQRLAELSHAASG